MQEGSAFWSRFPSWKLEQIFFLFIYLWFFVKFLFPFFLCIKFPAIVYLQISERRKKMPICMRSGLVTQKKKNQPLKKKVTNPKSTSIISYWINDRFFLFFLFKKGKKGVGKGEKLNQTRKNELGEIEREKVPLSLLKFSKGREERGRAQRTDPDVRLKSPSISSR